MKSNWLSELEDFMKTRESSAEDMLPEIIKIAKDGDKLYEKKKYKKANLCYQHFLLGIDDIKGKNKVFFLTK